MDDLISRQAAIDCMVLLQREDEETYGVSIPEGFDGDRAAEALNRLPSAQQWIPCSERLPDKEGEYLVTFNDKWHGPRVRTLWYGTPFDIIIDRDKWVFYCDQEYGFETFAPGKPIVAWMPLPKPYEGENNGHD